MEDRITHPRAHATGTRVVTLTPSPVIDRVYVVGTVHEGTVHRADRVETSLGGNGINVARVLRAHGDTVRAVTAMSAADAELCDQGLFRVVPTALPTRVNTIVVAADGATTNFNQRPGDIDAATWKEMVDAVFEEVRAIDADWLVVAGSFPTVAGAHPDAAGLMTRARNAGVAVCLDSHGSALKHWVRSGAAPDLAKPNTSELADATGRHLATVGDAVDAAQDLVDAGVGAVLASLGADGLLLVTPHERLWARAPRVRPVNTTGAGDATLGGYLSGRSRRGADAEHALRTAVSWGQHTVLELGTLPRTFSQIPGTESGTPPRGLLLEDHSTIRNSDTLRRA